MILIIDNFDSFVYTLAGYVQKLGFKTSVKRNNAITLGEIEQIIKPSAIILSPGPCTPQEAGICIALIKELGSRIPILGVCLGHQAIGEAYGGQTIRSEKPVHGKASEIEHDASALFHNLPSPFTAGRYHSLVTELPEHSPLIVNAASQSGEIMAMHHQEHPVYGVQFHPESILTPYGIDVIKNFLYLARDWNSINSNNL